MTAICDALIASDILPNCQDNATGFEAFGVIINKEDLDYAKLVYDTTYSNVVKTLALKDSKKGFKVKQLNKGAFNETQTSMNAGTFRNSFQNEVHVKLFDNGPAAAKIAKEIANGEYVLVLQQKQKNLQGYTMGAGESTYRIYGLENGLLATEITNDPNSEDLGNGWAFTLTETNASEAAVFMWNTDLETTEAQFDSLT